MRAWGWAPKAQRKQENPLREELYNEQMSQGSTADFITWTIQKRVGGQFMAIAPLCVRAPPLHEAIA